MGPLWDGAPLLEARLVEDSAAAIRLARDLTAAADPAEPCAAYLRARGVAATSAPGGLEAGEADAPLVVAVAVGEGGCARAHLEGGALVGSGAGTAATLAAAVAALGAARVGLAIRPPGSGGSDIVMAPTAGVVVPGLAANAASLHGRLSAAAADQLGERAPVAGAATAAAPRFGPADPSHPDRVGLDAMLAAAWRLAFLAAG